MARRPAEDRIRAVVAKWKPKLLLGHWSVEIVFPAADKPMPDGLTRYAEALVNGRYNECLLNVYPALLAKPFKYQQATIVHELTHIVTDDIAMALTKAANKKILSQKQLDDLVEGITEYITKLALLKNSNMYKDLLL